MGLEWKDLVSEPGVWSTNGEGGWCSVWPKRETFGAWVSWPERSEITDHPTESEAKDWCEAKMRAEANNG